MLLTACVIMAAIYLGLNIPESPMSAMLMLAGLVYVLTLGWSYWICAWCYVAFSSAALIVPALPGRPFFWEVAAVAAWPAIVVHLALNRNRFSAIHFSRDELRALLALVVYLGTLVMLMFMHGVGFRAFGGAQMGGRFYVQQLALGVIPLLFLLAPWSRRNLLGAIVASLVLSFTYIISDFALMHGGRTAQFLLNFFEVPGDAFHFYFGYELSGLRRYQSLSVAGKSLLMALLIAVPLGVVLFRRFYFGLPCLAAILYVGLLSGERTRLVQSILTLAILGLFQRIYTPPRIAALVLALFCGGTLLYTQADRLPLSIQRAVSFLPGIQVDPLAAGDAANTLRDRIAVVQLAVRDVPSRLLLGRGFGMERFDQQFSSPADDGVYLAYINGQFPNGFISLLVNTGLSGFLAAMGLVYVVSRVALQTLAAVDQIPAERQGAFERLTQLLVAQWFATVLFFFLLHGEASHFLTHLILLAALILVCRRLAPGPAGTSVPAT